MGYTLGQAFPRIPLNLKLPDELYEIEQLLSYSVKTELSDAKWNQGELEVAGSYVIEVRYIGSRMVQSSSEESESPVGCHCFYKNLALGASGYLNDLEEEISSEKGCSEKGSLEQMRCFCTYAWEDDIHTFVELRNPKYRRTSLNLEVQQCDLSVRGDSRSLQGSLILKLDKSV